MKQACLFLLKLNPLAHRLFSRIYLHLEELPVWNMCSFQFISIHVKENKFD